MKVPPAAAIVPCLVLLLTWLSLRAFNPEAELFDRALAELDRFAMIENMLFRDVFTARAGTLRNYDPLTQEIDALRNTLDRLRETAAFDEETTAAIDRLAASVERQEELVEQFKSNNALLHNSLAFFGRFKLGPDSQDLGPAVSAAAAAMLHLTLDTSKAVADEVEGRLDELANQPQSSDRDSVGALLAHGRLLQELLPAVDTTLKGIRAIRRKQEQDTLRGLLLMRQIASRTTARQFRRLLYGMSLLLVAFLVWLGIQLRRRANALKRRAAFEHVIAGISMRFINAPAENMDAGINRALAEMGQCLGTDRAYFVSSGPLPRLHVWCSGDIDCPRGWPERAMLLATRLGPADGVIHVSHVHRLPSGETKKVLMANDVGGWGCTTNVDKDGATLALGFEVVGRPWRFTDPPELGLLRMALDTIGHAVGRHALEKERARLERRLQQADRMEKIGAITSGIAHNFNNILGGILGHSEVIEEHFGSDTRVARNLGAIRRAAERARDLVDQILVFGCRRDARRRPINSHALVAESVFLLHGSLPPAIDLAVRGPLVAAILPGEPAQLQQVILNLCNNAAQAMDDGGRIEIDTALHEIADVRELTQGELRPGRYLSIAFTDTGRGMDTATQARIFEPFFTTRLQGNGLGLASVRTIVREHDGAINVRSAPGEGSRFEVWLPCVAAAAPEARASTLPAGQGQTVLIVADDNARLLGGEEMLAALGFEPVGFTSADAALAAFRAKPQRFDALVVGHLGSSALSLAHAAALHAAAPHLPIVLAAKSTDGIGADTLVAAGIVDVVQWPIAAEEIAAALNQCWRRSLQADRDSLDCPEFCE